MAAAGQGTFNKLPEQHEQCRQADFHFGKMHFANTQHVLVDATHPQIGGATSAGMAGPGVPFEMQLFEQAASAGVAPPNPAAALAPAAAYPQSVQAEPWQPAQPLAHMAAPAVEAVRHQDLLPPALGSALLSDLSVVGALGGAAPMQEDGVHAGALPAAQDVAPTAATEVQAMQPGPAQPQADVQAMQPAQPGDLGVRPVCVPGLAVSDGTDAAVKQDDAAPPTIKQAAAGTATDDAAGAETVESGGERRVSQSPSQAVESDPLVEDDKGPSLGANDSDFQFSEDERASRDVDSDYVFSDEEEDMKKKRWLRPAREGSRRSKRIKDETADGSEGQERATRRRGQETSTAQPSRTASEDFSEAIVSPLGTVVKREMTQEEIESDVKAVQGMWEMASVLDFLRKFKPQLKLSRDFGADELERVLVTSAGDGGLLADVHIDLMRGISPKNEVNPANWAVHLANKIKYHWKNLSDGTPCPFKPEKYFEAVTYATLPGQQRARTLNFLCCIRADKEDIQERMLAAENPKLAPKPPVPAKPPRPTRGQPPPPEPVEETLDSFRRDPTGTDASGITYYFFEMADSIGFRLYREIPAELVPASKASDKGGETGSAPAAPAVGESEKGGGEEGGEGRGGKPSQQAGGTSEAPPQGQKQGSKGRGSKRKKAPSLLLPPPPAAGRWELVASTLPELQSVGERLSRSMKPQDKDLGRTITEKAVQLVSHLQARQEAEDRRARAERRVQKKLGVDVQAEFGRARRERRNINYAFTDYDDVIRSAIKRSSRRDESPEDGGRRRRGPSPPKPDPVAEAQRGLRRGRSAAAIHEDMSMGDLSERQLRLLARSRSASGMSDTQDHPEQHHDEEEEGEEGQEEWGAGAQEAAVLPGAQRQWPLQEFARHAQQRQEAWDPPQQIPQYQHAQQQQQQYYPQEHQHQQQYQRDMYSGYRDQGLDYQQASRQQYVQALHQELAGQRHQNQPQGAYQQTSYHAAAYQPQQAMRAHYQPEQPAAGRRGAANRRVYYDQYEDVEESGEDVEQVSDDEYDPRYG